MNVEEVIIDGRSYRYFSVGGKQPPSQSYWDLAGSLLPMLRGTDFWDRRHKVLWYVSLCEQRGFADTDDQRRQCVQRYMAGKRKVSAPGTKRRRRAAQEMRKLLANVPPELIAAVDAACQSDMAKQVAGNPKALNALVGMVLQNHRAPPAVVRQLIEMRIGSQ